MEFIVKLLLGLVVFTVYMLYCGMTVWFINPRKDSYRFGLLILTMILTPVVILLIGLPIVYWRKVLKKC